ncbi:hypothetical protein SEPCBS57363_005611 [Sporothrix epigloea]|uniref:Uncharacterized protein n=1 Tax=Sporothrix epigloea TaxID=1892477 RepID=A0ABP0DYH9_9PEZI
MADKLPTLHKDLLAVADKSRLTSAVNDVDSIIAQLLEARDSIAAGKSLSPGSSLLYTMSRFLMHGMRFTERDPHAASLILTKLQNPIKEGFENVNNDLKAVSKTQKEFGKALDRSFPVTPIPTEYDVMQKHPALINRAIVMHLLREGHFDVARVFMDEARDLASMTPDLTATYDHNGVDDSGEDAAWAADGAPSNSYETTNSTLNESGSLQGKFQRLYSILHDIKTHNLSPAIQWSRANSDALEERGSNLEFDLCKLQFIWLAKSQSHELLLEKYHADAAYDGEAHQNVPIGGTLGAGAGSLLGGFRDGMSAALGYARDNFDRFRERHPAEIERLAAALVFASNIRESPYATVFETATAFEDLAAAFTREFCSLLGLSAESPLYVATTAGTIALPRLIKYIGATRSKRTEWTSANEMAFETPLPASMTYHSIFVCPVSKEQTTRDNPPMRLPCGHVLAHDSLHNLAKGTKFKCPYCPEEGQIQDARQIYF